MDQRVVISILVLLNTAFLVGIWHMSHNFMLREGRTKGVFGWDRETAYRVSEYVAVGAFILTDTLFIWAFLG